MIQLTFANLIKGGACAALTALSLTAAQTPAIAATENNYEIIRSSADRIWRLNKETGEVSVCTMEGDRLICTTSEDAAVPDKKSYEEIEEEREALEKERAERRAEDRERQMSMIDRMLEMFRELIAMGMENEAAKDAESL